MNDTLFNLISSKNLESRRLILQFFIINVKKDVFGKKVKQFKCKPQYINFA